MKPLAEFLVKSLADLPEAAEVDASSEDGATRLSIRVADDDKGKIIGKQGKVIKAIRNVASAAAAKAGKKVAVDLD